MTLQEFPAPLVYFPPSYALLVYKRQTYCCAQFLTAEILVSNMLQSRPLAAFALLFTAVFIEGAQCYMVVKTGCSFCIGFFADMKHYLLLPEYSHRILA
jgi:hypothetical protein